MRIELCITISFLGTVVVLRAHAQWNRPGTGKRILPSGNHIANNLSFNWYRSRDMYISTQKGKRKFSQ
jgi:hypothetical protein